MALPAGPSMVLAVVERLRETHGTVEMYAAPRRDRTTATSAAGSAVLAVGTAALVARSRAGDQAAFGELVTHYQSSAVGLAHYHVHHREDAFDIAQDAFIAAYLHLHELDDPNRFGGWLARIVVNLCMSWRRRRRSHLALDDPAARDLPASEDDDPAAAAERAEGLATLQQALLALPAPQRIVLSLYHVERLRYRQIAEALELPVTTVKGRLQQGQRRLADALGTSGALGVQPGRRALHAVRRRPAEPTHLESPPLKEAIMAKLAELVVRHSSAGSRNGLLFMQTRVRDRHVTVALPAQDAIAARPRTVPSSPPGTGLLIQTHTAGAINLKGAGNAEQDEANSLVTVRSDDFAFFADVLTRLSTTLTSVVLDLPAGQTEPRATLHFRRERRSAPGLPAGEMRRGNAAAVAVEAPAAYGLALAAATGAPLHATEDLLAVGRLGIGGCTPPAAARAAAELDQAESTHRLGCALAAAAQRAGGPFQVRLVPRGGIVKVIGADGDILATLPSTRLGFANLDRGAGAPAAGSAAISGVGRFSLVVTPRLTETVLELSPMQSA